MEKPTEDPPPNPRVGHSDQRLEEKRQTTFHKDPSLPKTMIGSDYQVNIAALLVTSALEQGNVRYNLSMEHATANKFDDVVFMFEENSEPKYRFLQAKHRTGDATIKGADLVAQGGDFSLMSYFKGYSTFREREEFKNVAIKDCIIYTTADLPSGINKGGTRTINCKKYINLIFHQINESDEFLNVSKWKKNARIYRLEVNEDIKRHLRCTAGVKDKSDEHIQEFLHLLKVYVQQPSVEELDHILVDKLKEIEDTVNDPKKFKHILCTSLRNWMAKPADGNQERYFTETDVLVLLLTEYSEEFRNTVPVKKGAVKIDNLVQNMHSHNVNLICISTTSSKLCCTKLLDHSPDSSRTFVLNITCLQKLQNLICSSFVNNEGAVFILCTDEKTLLGNKENLQKMLKYFKGSAEKEGRKVGLETTVENTNKKLSKFVLVIETSVEYNTGEMLDIYTPTCYNDHEYSFNSFSEDFKQLLMKKVISFQNASVQVQDIVGVKHMPCLDPQVIETLVTQEDIAVSRDPGKVQDVVEHFVPRNLYIEKAVKNRILYSPNEELFVVVNLNYDISKDLEHEDGNLGEILKLCKGRENIFLLDEEEANRKYISLCDTFPRKNIHKLCISKLSHGKFVLRWIDTYGSIRGIQASAYNDFHCDKQDISDEMTVVIAAEPGMGKSTLLTYLAQREQELHPSRWVVRVNFKDITDVLSRMQENTSFEDLSYILTDLQRDDNSLSKYLLRHSLEHTHNFSLFLDGYDEIEFEHREKVKQMLQVLQRNTKGRVIITTRLHYKADLEGAASCIAHRLKPFLKNQSEEYLANTWREKLGLDDDETERAYVYSRGLFEAFSMPRSYLKINFVDTPLQLVLLAEVYEDSCRIYCNTSDNNFDIEDLITMNVFDLLQKFERKRYTKYIQEFISDKETVLKTMFDLVCDEHRRICITHALNALFNIGSSSDHREMQKNNKVLFEDTQLLRIGILQKANDVHLSFTHRIFAEYFCAIHMVDMLMSNHLRAETLKLLQQNFYKPEYSVIRTFVDSMTATTKLHTAVIFNDLATVSREIEKVEGINKGDKLQRTAVHLSVAYKHHEILRLLLDKGSDVVQKDILHNLTPVRLAACFPYWKLCSIFLTTEKKVQLKRKEWCLLFIYLLKNGDFEHLKMMFKHLCSSQGKPHSISKIILSTDKHSNSGLHIAVDQGNFEVVSFIIDIYKKYCGVNIVNVIFWMNKYWKVPLLVAAYSCRFKCVQLMLESLEVGDIDFTALLPHIMGTMIMAASEASNAKDLQSELESRESGDHPALQETIQMNVFLKVMQKVHKGKVSIHSFKYKPRGLDNLYDKVKPMIGKLNPYANLNFLSRISFLHFVASYGTEYFIRYLLSKYEEEGEDVSSLICVEDNQRHTLLHYALWREREQLFIDMFNQVKEKECVISREDFSQQTFLHVAAFSGQKTVVKFLLQQIKTNGNTLYLVSDQNSPEFRSNENQLYDLLLEQILANNNTALGFILQCDFSGKTSIDYAEERNHKDIVNLLIDEIKREVGRILHNVQMKKMEHYFFSCHDLVEYLLNKRWSKERKLLHYITQVDKEGYSPLSYAAINNHLEMCELLLDTIEKEGAPLVQNLASHIFMDYSTSGVKYSKTLLECAVLSKNVALLEMILNKIKQNDRKVTNFISNIGKRGKSFVDLLQNSTEKVILCLLQKLQEEDEHFLIEILHQKLKGEDNLITFAIKHDYVHITNFMFQTIQKFKSRALRFRIQLSFLQTALLHASTNVALYLLSRLEQEIDEEIFQYIWSNQCTTYCAIVSNMPLLEYSLSRMEKRRQNTLKYILDQNTLGESVLGLASVRGKEEIVIRLLMEICKRGKYVLKKVINMEKYRKTLLHNAAKFGQVRILEFIFQTLKNKAKKNESIILRHFSTKDSTHRTPLQYAIEYHRTAVVVFIFSEVIRNERDTLRCFSKIDDQGMTILHYAAKCGSADFIQCFVSKLRESGGNVVKYLEKEDREGKTPIHHAFSKRFERHDGNLFRQRLECKRSKELIALLQELVKDEKEVVIYMAKYMHLIITHIAEYKDTKFLEFLLQNVRVAHLAKESLQKILVLCLESGWEEDCMGMVLDALEAAGEESLQYIAREENGWSALDHAILSYNYSCAEYFVQKIFERGGNILNYYSKNYYERRLFYIGHHYPGQVVETGGMVLTFVGLMARKVCSHYLKEASVKNCSFEIVKLLLSTLEENGQNIMLFLQENDARTLIYNSVEHGNDDFFKFLLEKIEENGEDISEYIKREGFNNLSILHTCLTRGRKELFQLVIMKLMAVPGNVDFLNYIYQLNSSGECLIHYACKVKDTFFIQFLVEKIKESGENVLRYLSEKSYSMNTPLYYAAKNGNLEVVKFLITTIEQNGGSVLNYISQVDDENTPTLHYPVLNRRTTGIRNIEVDDVEKTIIHCAVENRRLEIMEFLIRTIEKNGGSVLKYVSQVDGKNRSLFHYAALNGKVEIMNFLIKTLKKEEEKVTPSTIKH